MRDAPQGGKLAAAHLVHDLARGRPARLVHVGRLQAREGAHGPYSQSLVERQRLQTGEGEVAAKGGHEPRHAGHGHAAPGRVGEQHGQVFLAAPQQGGELLVVGVDLGALRRPAVA